MLSARSQMRDTRPRHQRLYRNLQRKFRVVFKTIRCTVSYKSPEDEEDYRLPQNFTEAAPFEPWYDGGDFPDSIRQCIWAHTLDELEGTWRLFCLLKNGLYGYFVASCCYTGFTCGGNMALYVHPDPSVLVTRCMTDYCYKLYQLNTRRAPCWAPVPRREAARRLAWACISLAGPLGRDLVAMVGRLL